MEISPVVRTDHTCTSTCHNKINAEALQKSNQDLEISYAYLDTEYGSHTNLEIDIIQRLERFQFRFPIMAAKNVDLSAFGDGRR